MQAAKFAGFAEDIRRKSAGALLLYKLLAQATVYDKVCARRSRPAAAHHPDTIHIGACASHKCADHGACYACTNCGSHASAHYHSRNTCTYDCSARHVSGCSVQVRRGMPAAKLCPSKTLHVC